MIAFVAGFLLLLADPPAKETFLRKPQMSFAAAQEPFQKFTYKYNGYVGPDGKVRNDGLGCSAFTSAVLHRMRDGDEWLKAYDPTVHQWYGDKAAEHFGLKKVDQFNSTSLLDPKETLAFLKDGKLAAGQLYYFNARTGKNGHVGFVRLDKEGAIEQWHYSSISNGLYCGDFRKWLQESMYRAAKVELYVVPEK
ncbi:MAG: hypothetical protein K8T89_03225 [Planctomycetes bacterium]|nr:hypothetical protein [Planctomycetota bacterium]